MSRKLFDIEWRDKRAELCIVLGPDGIILDVIQDDEVVATQGLDLGYLIEILESNEEK